MAEKSTRPGMMMKIAIIGALVVVVAAAVIAKNGAKNNRPGEPVEAKAAPVVAELEGIGAEAAPVAAAAIEADRPEVAEPKPLPKLVDLGAGKCIPCKMMAPILEGLRGEYEGRFDVIFIDVWENKLAGEQYGIRVIPTQIFFDAAGNELFRHEGFYSKEDILATWKEYGQDFAAPAASVEPGAVSDTPAG